MGLITKKDVIRNMASLEENDDADLQEEGFEGFEAQEGGLLDDDDRHSDS